MAERACVTLGQLSEGVRPLGPSLLLTKHAPEHLLETPFRNNSDGRETAQEPGAGRWLPSGVCSPDGEGPESRLSREGQARKG